jgi:hypothetical protein
VVERQQPHVREQQVEGRAGDRLGDAKAACDALGELRLARAQVACEHEHVACDQQRRQRLAERLGRALRLRREHARVGRVAADRRGGGEQLAQALEVGEERVALGAIVDGGGRVEDRQHREASCLLHLAVQACDASVGLEHELGREVAESDEHVGLDDADLLAQKRADRLDLDGLGSRLPGGRHFTTLAM